MLNVLFTNFDGLELLYIVAFAYIAIIVMFVFYFWRFTKESFLSDLQEREYLLRCNPSERLPDYLQTVELRLASWFLHKVNRHR